MDLELEFFEAMIEEGCFVEELYIFNERLGCEEHYYHPFSYNTAGKLVDFFDSKLADEATVEMLDLIVNTPHHSNMTKRLENLKDIT